MRWNRVGIWFTFSFCLLLGEKWTLAAVTPPEGRLFWCIPEPPTIYTRQNSAALLCVKYYYYSTSSETINTASLLYLDYSSSNQSALQPNMNFTVSAFPTSLTLGGTSNLNEGALVLYTISTGDTSNGTYILSLNAYLYNPSGPNVEACGGYTTLIVSNSNPNYAFGYHSRDYCSGVYYGSALNSHGFVYGLLTAKVVGVSDST